MMIVSLLLLEMTALGGQNYVRLAILKLNLSFVRIQYKEKELKKPQKLTNRRRINI
jgi:hypothetical protein